jgi:alkylation response protein AidB-like acyl-CoA dehydrogenase
VRFDWSAEQTATRERVRAFVASELAPRVVDADRRGRFPVDLVARLGELGLLAGPVPRAYGGAGMSHSAFAVVYEELGRVDASFRGFVAVHGGLVSLVLADHGSEEQRQQWLPALCSGRAIGCYCLTEPEAGSDAGAIRTTARRDGDGYVLDGVKTWITNGTLAHLALVFARDPEIVADRPHRQICAFLVPTTTPGFVASPLEGAPLGHRAADHATIRLTGCRVPGTALLGAAGRGFHIAMAALDYGRLGVAAGAVGLGQAALDAALAHAVARRAFGQRVADFEMIQAALADASVDVEGARLLTYRAAWLKDEGLPSTRATASAKLAATEAALRAADQAVLILGARGYSSEFPVERLWRDAKGMQIYEGTSHIQRIVIARELVRELEAGTA